MAEAGVVGLGRLTLSRRERMVAVEPRGTGIALFMLRAASRCNPPWREAGCPPTAAISPSEVATHGIVGPEACCAALASSAIGKHGVLWR